MCFLVCIYTLNISKRYIILEEIRIICVQSHPEYINTLKNVTNLNLKDEVYTLKGGSK